MTYNFSQKNDLIELLSLFRLYAQYENELINHRTTWFITLQSFLIATFGYSLQKYYEISEKIAESNNAVRIAKSLAYVTKEIYVLSFILSTIGIVSCIVAFIGILAAIRAQRSLEKLWREKHLAQATSYDLPFIAGGEDNSAVFLGDFLALSMPILLFFCWLATILFVLLKVKIEIVGGWP